MVRAKNASAGLTRDHAGAEVPPELAQPGRDGPGLPFRRPQPAGPAASWTARPSPAGGRGRTRASRRPRPPDAGTYQPRRHRRWPRRAHGPRAADIPRPRTVSSPRLAHAHGPTPWVDQVSRRHQGLPKGTDALGPAAAQTGSPAGPSPDRRGGLPDDAHCGFERAVDHGPHVRHEGACRNGASACRSCSSWLAHTGRCGSRRVSS